MPRRPAGVNLTERIQVAATRQINSLVALFVGETPRGPIDPFYTLDWNGARNLYGSIDPSKDGNSMMHGLYFFFQRGGIALVKRVMRPGFRYAGMVGVVFEKQFYLVPYPHVAGSNDLNWEQNDVVTGPDVTPMNIKILKINDIEDTFKYVYVRDNLEVGDTIRLKADLPAADRDNTGSDPIDISTQADVRIVAIDNSVTQTATDITLNEAQNLSQAQLPHIEMDDLIFYAHSFGPGEYANGSNTAGNRYSYQIDSENLKEFEAESVTATVTSGATYNRSKLNGTFNYRVAAWNQLGATRSVDVVVKGDTSNKTFDASADNSVVKINWNRITNADGYRIYRRSTTESDSNVDKWFLVGEANNTASSFTDYNLPSSQVDDTFFKKPIKDDSYLTGSIDDDDMGIDIFIQDDRYMRAELETTVANIGDNDITDGTSNVGKFPESEFRDYAKSSIRPFNVMFRWVNDQGEEIIRENILCSINNQLTDQGAQLEIQNRFSRTENTRVKNFYRKKTDKEITDRSNTTR